jgi:hypothetical protein
VADLKSSSAAEKSELRDLIKTRGGDSQPTPGREEGPIWTEIVNALIAFNLYSLLCVIRFI